MKQNTFIFLCVEHLIEPSIALENERVVAAIQANDIEALKAALREDF